LKVESKLLNLPKLKKALRMFQLRERILWTRKRSTLMLLRPSWLRLKPKRHAEKKKAAEREEQLKWEQEEAEAYEAHMKELEVLQKRPK
jgi:hypothetical protein